MVIQSIPIKKPEPGKAPVFQQWVAALCAPAEWGSVTHVDDFHAIIVFVVPVIVVQ
ncbi:hypothetical protein Ri1_34070 [Aeromonas dhakensis]|nr:hypothetical protein Ri1_34070 [Aeromonas dhakensis]